MNFTDLNFSQEVKKDFNQHSGTTLKVDNVEYFESSKRDHAHFTDENGNQYMYAANYYVSINRQEIAIGKNILRDGRIVTRTNNYNEVIEKAFSYFEPYIVLSSKSII